MRNKILIGLILLVSLRSEARSFHVLSFNIHCTFESWELRIEELARILGKIRPDIIAFQEVCRDQANDMPQEILRALRRNGYPVSSYETQFSHMAWDKYEELQMTISRHRPEEIIKGLLPKSPLQRAFLALKIDGVWYINVHLEYLDDYADYRSQQIRFLTEKFEKTPHLIFGDYNSEPSSSEQIQLHKKGYSSFFPGPTYPAHNPVMAIDGFWGSPELRGRLFRSESNVLLKEIFQGNYLSDHFAIEFKAEL